MLRPLPSLKKYHNHHVVSRFAKDHGVSIKVARELFDECKRWLWLCAHQAEHHPKQEPLVLFNEAAPIDAMWHTFLLFTHDYSEFCEKYLGRFVHHVPNTRAIARSLRKARLRETFEYIYDHLGAATLTKWCESLPQV
jgi:hypothetical protein